MILGFGGIKFILKKSLHGTSTIRHGMRHEWAVLGLGFYRMGTTQHYTIKNGHVMKHGKHGNKWAGPAQHGPFLTPLSGLVNFESKFNLFFEKL